MWDCTGCGVFEILMKGKTQGDPGWCDEQMTGKRCWFLYTPQHDDGRYETGCHMRRLLDPFQLSWTWCEPWQSTLCSNIATTPDGWILNPLQLYFFHDLNKVVGKRLFKIANTNIDERNLRQIEEEVKSEEASPYSRYPWRSKHWTKATDLNA